MNENGLILVDVATVNMTNYKAHMADCVVVTHDNKILLQKRTEGWSNAGGLNLFGGHVEDGETPVQGMIRELNEELGARIDRNDVRFIGAVSEDFTGHTELVHIFLWHDKDATITGCYECEAVSFGTIEEAINQPGLMEYARWALKRVTQTTLPAGVPPA